MLSFKAKGQILEWRRPLVMAIVNATPDSFHAASRCPDAQSLAARIDAAVAQGADILDVGGCSTRPGSAPPPPDEEWRRLEPALRHAAKAHPDVPLSVDTFRAEIARRAAREYGADIINDISGGLADPDMIPTAGRLGVALAAGHAAPVPGQAAHPELLRALARHFAHIGRLCAQHGVADLWADPGIGFAKTLDQNYAIINHLDCLKQLGMPLLVGVSRKSMLYKLLGITPGQALNATTAMHALALARGADILRAHDVAQAVECVRIAQKTFNS